MKVNEIFHSLQGEGYFTGTPAVFVRLAGCNLSCPFCDTRHQSYTEMTEDEIVAEVANHNCRHTVITGGEPTLQLTASLVDRLHRLGRFVQIETNGSRPAPAAVDWVTCSPKEGTLPAGHIDELKVLYHGRGQDLSLYDSLTPTVRCLQPCDIGDPRRNASIIAETIEAVKADPRWRLSLQTHKLLNIR